MPATEETRYVRMKPDDPTDTAELEEKLQVMFPDLFPGLKKLSATNWRLPVSWERRWELADGQKLQELCDEGLLADAQLIGEE